MRLLLYILLTCQILATAQTMNTTLVSGGGDGDNCVVTDTRANLINLRNTNGYSGADKWVVIYKY